MIEYRICWAASSNATFRGHTDWEPWDDQNESEDEILATLNRTAAFPGEGLEVALDASGFEWWVETRRDDV